MTSALSRIHALADVLRGPLPAPDDPSPMWPPPLPQRSMDEAPDDLRRAAVLILLYPQDGRVCFPLMRRTHHYEDTHAGQISLPGGSREEVESPEQTALRETREELGIDTAHVELLGRLSPRWIPVSGYRVLPLVGWTETPPSYDPDTAEVEQLLLCSLEELESRECLGSFEHIHRGAQREIPCWHLEGGILWGATAIILSELLSLARPTSAWRPGP